MAYSVIVDFVDMTDNNTLYHVGDSYPRLGYEPTKSRISELSSKDNKLGRPVIAEIKAETAEPKKRGRKPTK